MRSGAGDTREREATEAFWCTRAHLASWRATTVDGLSRLEGLRRGARAGTWGPLCLSHRTLRRLTYCQPPAGGSPFFPYRMPTPSLKALLARLGQLAKLSGGWNGVTGHPKDWNGHQSLTAFTFLIPVFLDLLPTTPFTLEGDEDAVRWHVGRQWDPEFHPADGDAPQLRNPAQNGDRRYLWEASLPALLLLLSKLSQLLLLHSATAAEISHMHHLGLATMVRLGPFPTPPLSPSADTSTWARVRMVSPMATAACARVRLPWAAFLHGVRPATRGLGRRSSGTHRDGGVGGVRKRHARPAQP
jgi:hypothetical protein